MIIIIIILPNFGHDHHGHAPRPPCAQPRGVVPGKAPEEPGCGCVRLAGLREEGLDVAQVVDSYPNVLRLSPSAGPQPDPPPATGVGVTPTPPYVIHLALQSGVYLAEEGSAFLEPLAEGSTSGIQ